MSQIKAAIQEDVKTAMKAREQHVLLTLRGLVAAIKQVEVDTRTELNDERVIAIIQTEIKKRRDALQFAETGQRQDLIDQNNAEIKILQKYLGEQLSEDQLRDIISKLIAEGNDAIGKIMGALNKNYKGKFEGRIASDVAQGLLKK